jgi:hypothetical protein
VFAYVAATVAHFVSFEVVDFVETLGGFGLLATVWRGAFVSALRIEAVIYVAVEVGRAMKPRADSDEDATGKPFGAVVAVGSTGVRSVIVVAVGTLGGDSDIDGDLSLRLWSGH